MRTANRREMDVERNHPQRTDTTGSELHYAKATTARGSSTPRQKRVRGISCARGFADDLHWRNHNGYPHRDKTITLPLVHLLEEKKSK
ncbi:MAG: hypothetical protein ACKVT0_02185 [Planctomycetaceae bacterium]